jgi:oxygen-independent coproporphyrinogen-3 oxidase
VLRTEKPRNPERYMVACEAGGPVGAEREVEASELPFEFMLNALRLTEGFENALFAERTGLPWETVLPRVALAERRGLIERTHERTRPSALGRAFLNELQALFL